MKLTINRSMATLVLILSLLFSQSLYAHIMVAQQGTLNVAEDGVYIVISLPVSAFMGIDDDKDGKLSSEEFALHRPAIIKIVHSKIILKDQSALFSLQGIMLSPVTSHHSPKTPASQLVVMGRFTLPQPDVKPNSALEFQINLFGKATTEKTLKITVTRKADDIKQVFQLSEKKSKVSLFEAKPG